MSGSRYDAAAPRLPTTAPAASSFTGGSDVREARGIVEQAAPSRHQARAEGAEGERPVEQQHHRGGARQVLDAPRERLSESARIGATRRLRVGRGLRRVVLAGVAPGEQGEGGCRDRHREARERQEARIRPVAHGPEQRAEQRVADQDVADKEQHGVEHAEDEQADEAARVGGRRGAAGAHPRELALEAEAEEQGEQDKELALEQGGDEQLRRHVQRRRTARRRGRVGGEPGQVDNADADQREAAQRVREAGARGLSRRGRVRTLLSRLVGERHAAAAGASCPVAAPDGASRPARWCAAIQPKHIAGPSVMPPPG